MYYVYTLTDPRDNAVFYIGKGKGNRLHQHTTDVRHGRPSYNERKSNRIASILQGDLEPIAAIVAEFTDEAAAFEHERHLIATTHGLTNILPGGGGFGLSPKELAIRSRRKKAVSYWRTMRFFQHMLSLVEKWPGVTFPGIEDGDRKAEDLLAYMRRRVTRWENLKVRLRAELHGNAA